MRLLTTFLALFLMSQMSFGQNQDSLVLASNSDSSSIEGIPVILNLDTLFFFYGNLGPFTAEERARAVEKRLRLLRTIDAFDPGNLSAVASGVNYDIRYEQFTVLTVTIADSRGRGLSVEQTAEEHVQIIKLSLSNDSRQRGVLAIVKIVGSILLVILVVWGLIWLINKGFRKIFVIAEAKSDYFEKKFKLNKYKLITVDRQKSIIMGTVKLGKILVIFLVLYLALPVMFSVLPFAGDLTEKLIGYVTYPLKTGALAMLAYIPSLVTIIVVVYVMRLFVNVMRSLSREVAMGKIELKGFYPDWAMPTFNLIQFVVYMFTFVLIFPLLPGSGSDVFAGVSVFLGLLISLGSQSAISNIISGLVITYMRAFNIGDRVKIGNTVGDVVERSMLVTKVRTVKNEDVTIPNSNIMTSHTINYTSAQQDTGLILHTTVTIGYDVPWREVRALLIDAALKTVKIKAEPAPFVLQTSLDDFYVSYQLNAYTMHSASAAAIYSDLHSNIQDTFATANVEIMSPHYRVNRQTMESTIPSEGVEESRSEGDEESRSEGDEESEN